jgi:poly-D-alanine transfer protein DltD
MELRQLLPIAIAFVVIAVALSVGSDVLTEVQDNFADDNNSTAYNASGKGLSGLTKISNWLPTIGLVVGASVVIGTLIYYFAFRGR